VQSNGGLQQASKLQTLTFGRQNANAIELLGRFQGQWEEWDSFIVPRFPSARHFHRFCFSVAFLIIDLLTVGLHLRDILQILLRFDESEWVPKPLVLDDRGAVNALVLSKTR
jgi:hypothetical protein